MMQGSRERPQAPKPLPFHCRLSGTQLPVPCLSVAARFLPFFVLRSLGSQTGPPRTLGLALHLTPKRAGGFSPGLWRKRLINLSVARLSYEHMGCPQVCPETVRIGVPLNRKQWQLVRSLERIVFGSFFPLTFEPEDYGRIGHKVEGQANTLRALGPCSCRFVAELCRVRASLLFVWCYHRSARAVSC